MKKACRALLIIFGIIVPLFIITDVQMDNSHSFIKKTVGKMADKRELALLQNKFLRLSDERKEMVMEILSLFLSAENNKDFFIRLSEQEVVMEAIEEEIKKNFSPSTPEAIEEEINHLREIIPYYKKINEKIASYKNFQPPSGDGVVDKKVKI